MPGTRQVVGTWYLLLLCVLAIQPPGLWLGARKAYLFPLLFPSFPSSAAQPAPRLPHCLSWGKGATAGVLLNIWDGRSSTLGFLGPRREPAEGDRTRPWPYLLWPSLLTEGSSSGSHSGQYS